MGAAWLVLPTYNEADNVAAIVAATLPVLREASPSDHRILIVDDGSPDGTGALADRLAAEHPGEVEVLHRPRKAGLGRAYLAGFGHALANGAGRVCEMDADFSHNPADLGRLLAAVAVADGADLAIGSRYVSGGRVEGWGGVRRALSRSGCWYAEQVLGLGIRDLTGGFKCFRREVLEAIDLHSVRSQGYAFQVELTYRTCRNGFRVRELPIVFHDREAGTSKMSWQIAAEAIWRVPQMRLRAD